MLNYLSRVESVKLCSGILFCIHGMPFSNSPRKSHCYRLLLHINSHQVTKRFPHGGKPKKPTLDFLELHTPMGESLGENWCSARIDSRYGFELRDICRYVFARVFIVTFSDIGTISINGKSRNKRQEYLIYSTNVDTLIIIILISIVVVSTSM